ncbi:MAG: phage baseplate protein [Paenibacillaceae bacterium]|nr:phage baseplate protein [Paenibacillaceae bacterium]
MNDVVRVGRISSVNQENGMVRVYYPDRDSTTSELGMFCFLGEYKPPRVNDQVIVLHLSNDTSSGVVLGGFWNEVRKAPREMTYKKEMDSNSYESLQNGTFTLHSQEISLEGEKGAISLTEILDLKARLERLERSLSQ